MYGHETAEPILLGGANPLNPKHTKQQTYFKYEECPILLFFSTVL